MERERASTTAAVGKDNGRRQRHERRRTNQAGLGVCVYRERPTLHANPQVFLEKRGFKRRDGAVEAQRNPLASSIALGCVHIGWDAAPLAKLGGGESSGPTLRIERSAQRDERHAHREQQDRRPASFRPLQRARFSHAARPEETGAPTIVPPYGTKRPPRTLQEAADQEERANRVEADRNGAHQTTAGEPADR